MTARILSFPVTPATQTDFGEVLDLDVPERDSRPLCKCWRAADVWWGNESWCALHANEFIDTEGHEFFADVLHYRELEYVKERGDLEMQLRASLQETWR